MDRRLTPANARAALQSLRGSVEAPRYTPGEAMQVALPLVDLLASPSGARERQLLLGDGFTVIDRHQGYAFGQAARDGYCGYLPEAALGPPQAPTHWIAALGSHLYSGPKVQAPETASLSFGARLTVLGTQGKFSETPKGFVPTCHLREIGDWFSDPVGVAESFLGTPYLWGGNSRAGLDCSGLVQASLLACGQQCPGDSDLQQALGTEIPEDAPLQRGDLLFWKGHVAMAMDAARMIHATGHAMAVVIEDTASAIARIISQGGGPVTHRRRL
ncbi:C40 family peptidase [Rhodobacter ferrooxidans]|uniref:NLP/P60 protein n=1 Tax=Rhodobacter ferrooxidans TaxID=371731 RepID=C8RW51_9RHOB|nr:NlpC/P60 family protein [Rhodobacter sp. SW2]EEW26794.1 NLP/P60 protein [Rhodobacter sp. SW2]